MSEPALHAVASAEQPEERVVLVDEHDRELGTRGKMRAHLDGDLHRGFSVFVFAPDQRILLQRRALTKYHSPGLWSNACCGHPRWGEAVPDAAQRRMTEELGFACELDLATQFIYRVGVSPGLIEHEYLSVFVGTAMRNPVPDPAEVDSWRWCSRDMIDRELADDPSAFTPWFPIAWRALADSPLNSRGSL